MLLHTIISKPAALSQNVGNIKKLTEETEFPIIYSLSENHAQGIDTLKEGDS